MKKLCAWTLLLGLVLGTLAGCSTAQEGAPPPESAEAASQTDEAAATPDSAERAGRIRMVMEGASGSTAQAREASFTQILDSYREATGTEVEFVFVPDEDYRTWQTTQQAGGGMPEVYSTRLAWVWEDYAKGQCIDLTSYLEEESPHNPGMSWQDTFIKFQLDQTLDPTSQKYVSAMQKLVAVRIAYNKTVFQEAGVTDEPTTWQEFIEACQKLKGTGTIPFAFAMQSGSQYPSWFLTTLFGQLDEPLRRQMDIDGDDMISKNEFAKATVDGLIDYSQDPFKTGFELLLDFSQYWNSDYNAVDATSAEQMWLMGDAAMLAILSDSMLNLTQMEGMDFEYGLFPLPLVTEDTSPLASGKCTMLGGAANESWAISSTTSGAELNSAVDLIRYLTCPQVQEKLGADLYFIPVINDVSLPSELEGFAMRDYEDIRRANYTGPATLNEFSTYITLSLQLFLTGELTFDQFAADLNSEWQQGMTTAIETAGWSEENNYGIAS